MASAIHDGDRFGCDRAPAPVRLVVIDWTVRNGSRRSPSVSSRTNAEAWPFPQTQPFLGTVDQDDEPTIPSSSLITSRGSSPPLLFPDFAIAGRFPDARAAADRGSRSGKRAQLELGHCPRGRLELVGGHGDPPLIVDPIVDPQAIERATDLDQVVRREPSARGEVGVRRRRQGRGGQVAEQQEDAIAAAASPQRTVGRWARTDRRAFSTQGRTRPRAGSGDDCWELRIDPPPDYCDRSARTQLGPTGPQRSSSAIAGDERSLQRQGGV